MKTEREVVIVSGVRTAVGTYGGGLSEVPAVELAGKCVAAAIDRAGIPGPFVLVGHSSGAQ